MTSVDVTGEMLAKSRSTAAAPGMQHVEFRDGLAEALPVDNGWADVVISDQQRGHNLGADKRAVFAEIHRVPRPNGVQQFADIANRQPVPATAINNIDLWTPELHVVCRDQPGSKCCRKSALSVRGSDRRLTLFKV